MGAPDVATTVSLELLARCTPDGVVLLDREGRLRWADATACRLLGAEESGAAALGPVWPVELGALALRSEVPAPSSEAATWDAEAWVRTPAGPRQLACRVLPAPEAGGPGAPPRGRLLLLRPARPQPGVQRSLLDAARFRSLVRGLHDSELDPKAPLNAAVLNADLLRSSLEESPPPEDEAPLRQLRLRRLASLEAALRRVDSVLRRIFGPPAEPVPVDLALLCRRLAATFAHHAYRERRRLRVDAPEGAAAVVRIRADELEQALVELVTNAMEASRPEDEIAVSLRVQGDVACVSVEDDGEGMDAWLVARAFEPHFTTREGAQGIGLCIARAAAEGHGGSLALESRPGRGTRARLRLPVARPAHGVA